MSAPIRVLELRSARGAGDGPDKTIVAGAAASRRDRYAITVCYLQDQRDDRFSIGARAESAGVDFVPVEERHSFDPAVWPALLRIVRDRRIDVVHAHDYKTDLLALALARRTGIVPLATVHNWCGRSLRERLFYYPADKRLMRFFPLVIAVSTPIRHELLRLGVPPSRIRMLVNGVDVAAFTRDPEVVAEARATAGASAGDWLIGAVGRLEAEKRYDLLIEAAAELRERGRAVRVAIVGEGSERPRLEALAAERGFGFADRCWLPGHRADVARVCQGYDVFVQSSDDEGTSNALLEAMALEVPIVATNVGGTSDIATDGFDARLVPPRDVLALADVIEQTLVDREATAVRVRNARQRVEGPLSFAARNRALERIYEELVTNGAGATRRLAFV
jgi:glycosyltransferase involved in cell wall biosynthesis